jgi:hypothetical protein
LDYYGVAVAENSEGKQEMNSIVFKPRETLF